MTCYKEFPGDQSSSTMDDFDVEVKHGDRSIDESIPCPDISVNNRNASSARKSSNVSVISSAMNGMAGAVL